MLKKICAAVGGFVIRSCHDTGRIMQLFLDTAARLKNADARETIRQMSRLGADSLPIVLMTILFTGMVFALQTATEFVRFGAASSVGGIVAIALGRELVPVLTGVVVAGRIGAAIAAGKKDAAPKNGPQQGTTDDAGHTSGLHVGGQGRRQALLRKPVIPHGSYLLSTAAPASSP